jgi:(1->4)-alpha-D-glucan 1-alpha-D-glucosylmutase
MRAGAVVTVVPRLVLGLGGERTEWNDTTLELLSGRWRNVLTGDEFEGGIMSMSELLQRFPVGLLSREEEF